MRMKRRMYTLLTVAIVMGMFLGSCLKEPNYAELEQSNIQEFLDNNPDISFQKKESGLYYHEVSAGTGEVVRTHDTAKVIYAAKFLNGVVFDTNVGIDTYSFPVGESKNIPGFDEGISYMKQGGTADFVNTLSTCIRGIWSISGTWHIHLLCSM